MLYNANAQTGFLFDKLRNIQRKNNQIPIQHDTIPEEYVPIDADDEANLIQYFKNCVIRNELNDLKEKLRSTINYRRELLLNPPEPIHKMFGFYFVSPELVSYTKAQDTFFLQCY